MCRSGKDRNRHYCNNKLHDSSTLEVVASEL